MNAEITKEIRKQIAEAMASGLPENTGEIIVREGEAMPLHEPVKVNIAGTIDAPARWLETRHDCVKEKTCHVIVNREKLTVTLRCNENNHYGSCIAGSLTLSPEFERFGINNGEYMTNFEMAELFKMNRTFFESRTVAMQLVTDLQNFKAKVDKDIEQSDNKRGDRRILVNQAVQHNLPEAFSLHLPVFKGTEAQTVLVEVYVNPADLTCTLVSPEACDLIESMRDALINDTLDRIKAVCPDIVIIEQ